MVCDTEPDTVTYYNCGYVFNTCSTDVNTADPNNPFTTDMNDDNYNYMSYGDLVCKNKFTHGQANRMNYFLSYYSFNTNLCMNTNSIINTKKQTPLYAISPNPFTETITVSINSPYTISIYDVTYRLIERISNEYCKDINLVHLNRGIYFYEIHDPEKKLLQKGKLQKE